MKKEDIDILLITFALSKMGDAIYLLSSEGKFIYVNDTACKMTGYSRDELLSLCVSDIDPAYPLEKVKEGWPIIRKKKILTLEGSHRRKDGTEFPVELTANYFEYKGEDYACSIVRDISIRKDAEEKYKSLVERSPGILYRYSNKRAGTYYSPRVESILGYTISYLYENPNLWHDSIHPDDLGRVDQAIQDMALGMFFDLEYRIRDANGNWHWFRDCTIRIQKNDSEVIVEGLASDITESKKMEEELQKIQKLESLGLLAGGIAHDFNNLLTGVIGNLSLIENKIDTHGDIYQRLMEAERAALRAQELTQQLLTFSRGGTPIKKTISLGLLINESACLAFRGSNVGCECSFPEDLWSIDADEGQIVQVINNLIINADQAMPDGGIIKVSAENFTVTKKDNLLLNDGRYVRIFIKDTGTGIPDKILSKIFDPYFTTKQKGSGLGLASSYSIVNKHGGHIEVSSNVGVGTTFSICLPASDKKAVVKEESNYELPTSVSGRILVMDDEEIIRDVATAILTGFGYEVATATGGIEAIRLYKEARDRGAPFNAVILDLTIPGGIGGMEAIKSLLEYDPDARVIVSSGYSNNPIMADYKKYGFSEVVTKPYKATELRTKVYQVITGKN